LAHQINLLLSHAPSGIAVRSSGISEDSESASFAGVYECCLGLWNVEEALEGIISCWCSAWTPAAVHYEMRMTGEVAVDAMAVLVKAVIPAETSGILITADPVTGNPWQFELNAVFGLAQNLVSGAVPADRFQMDWYSGDIIHEEIADKTVRLVVDQSGIKEETLAPTVSGRASVTSYTLKYLLEMGRQLDTLFDQWVDIEWAVASGQVYLIQVRPITALPAFFPMFMEKGDMEKSWKKDCGGDLPKEHARPTFHRFSGIPGNRNTGSDTVPRMLISGHPRRKKEIGTAIDIKRK